jgi:hypothetical protein
MRKKIVLMVLMLIAVLCSVHAEDTPNSRQARRIFNQAYQQVFGEQGASLHYDVNITGIYKTNGTIWYKGKKSKFQDSRVTSWNDGKLVLKVKRKKKEVEVHNAKNNKSDKYSQKFKFEPDNYTYSIAQADGGLDITLKLIKGRKGMKEIHALIERNTYRPISVRIKIAFIWTTIKISNFQSGGITDEMLRFPKERYKDYKYVDKR